MQSAHTMTGRGRQNTKQKVIRITDTTSIKTFPNEQEHGSLNMQHTVMLNMLLIILSSSFPHVALKRELGNHIWFLQ